MNIQQQIQNIIDVGVLKIEQAFVDFERKMLLADIRQDIMELRLIEKCTYEHVNSLIMINHKAKLITRPEAWKLLRYNLDLGLTK